ncbi:N-acetylglucosamine kinase [Cellulomonas alba]|uniref:BadF/BadG/BcrA/BcrD ATPase family protein n=1 Tax=Cellulomonas alba TaxID=3053467 RepID=A0ABT7SI75_9CELL|nr:BadF/BadG/BcrA/BcrD ATPase family protein [Cellulomonas alba]MDM7855257.1 BadF/BadG/BcrA/BcrD ATPase family protein [Cellulomonas alba]
MSGEVLVAVDGGGSKTDVLALAADGTVLAHARDGGSCPQVIGVDAALAVVDRLVRGVLRDVGAGGVARAGVYLSGLDLPVEVETFTAALAGLDWFAGARSTEVDNDTFALLRAGTDAAQGVAVVCGTGINCVGRRADGTTARFPALGRISGDWGGGYELGELAIWHAVRAHDGRGPATRLEHLVPAALGRDDIDQVTADLHFGRLPVRTIPALAPVVLAASADGDAVARDVVLRQADEVATLALVAIERLGLRGAEVPVVLGGGVLASGDAVLLDAIAARLADGAPGARPVVVVDRPVVGAALLGLDAVGAPAAARDRLRATVPVDALAVRA